MKLGMRAFAVYFMLFILPSGALAVEPSQAAETMQIAQAAPAAEGESNEGAAAEHEHGGAPGPVNWLNFGNKKQPPYAAMVINFLILAAMYYFLGKKAVARALSERRATITKEIEEAQRMKREAEERAKHYQAKLEHLEEELETTKRALIEAGKGERDRIVREAEARAARMEKDTHLLVEQELRQMRQSLLEETVEAAVAAAEQLLKARVTSDDQERLAEEFLAQLGARTRPASVVPAPLPPRRVAS